MTRSSTAVIPDAASERARLIVIGASAGGLQALTTIVERLPTTIRACLLIVVHHSSGDGMLPAILSNRTGLPVAFAVDGDRIEAGRIFVARPDYHLLVADSSLQLGRGPRENGFRPAVDPLFRTAARAFGPRAIGVVLSGALSDGAYGLSVLKSHGAVAIVQDPDDALVPSMPQRALDAVEADYVAPASRIADILAQLTERGMEVKKRSAAPSAAKPPREAASDDTEVSEMRARFGAASGLTCPDCGGALWEIQDGRTLRYQCHVGHQYAPENLEAGQRDVIDGALWSAVRVLEEHAELKMRMARRAEAGGLPDASSVYVEGARDAQAQAERLRRVLLRADDEAVVEPGTAKAVPVRNGAPAPRRSARGARKAPAAKRR